MFFHSIIQERKHFDSIGWNNSYEWMISDFETSDLLLQIYSNQDTVPYQSINFIIS